MTDEIIKSINKTTKSLKDISNLPKEQGIYVFYIDNTNDLGKFGKPGQPIYVGLSEKNLNSRDTETHLKTGQTGWSTLRRSIGAILKAKLKLTAEKRDNSTKKLRADKYKFDEKGERELTEWMMNNLKMGYWSTSKPLTKDKLRIEEEKVIIKLKPTLDLDIRTKKFNLLAIELDALRESCRQEVNNKN